MSCNLSWCRLQKKYLKKRQGMSLLKPLHPKFPVVLPLLMQLFHQIQRLRPRPGLRNPSLPNVGPRDAFLILECRGKSCDMTWQYIPWGWSHLDQIKTWFQRWKLSVIIVYLQSCMIHVLAWKNEIVIDVDPSTQLASQSFVSWGTRVVLTMLSEAQSKHGKK